MVTGEPAVMHWGWLVGTWMNFFLTCIQSCHLGSLKSATVGEVFILWKLVNTINQRAPPTPESQVTSTWFYKAVGIPRSEWAKKTGRKLQSIWEPSHECPQTSLPSYSIGHQVPKVIPSPRGRELSSMPHGRRVKKLYSRGPSTEKALNKCLMNEWMNE